MIMVTLHTSLPYLPDLYFNVEVRFFFFLFLLLQWFVVAWSHLLFIWFCLDMCVNLDSYLLCDVLRLIVYVMNPFFFDSSLIPHSLPAYPQNSYHTTNSSYICMPANHSFHPFLFISSIAHSS